MKLYVREAFSAGARRAVSRATVVASSRVAYPEARAAFARRRREGGLTSQGLRRAVADLDSDLGKLVVVELLPGLSRKAGDLAERHGLRGFDAIHLASALEFGQLLNATPVFLAFDGRLNEAAHAEGLFLRPEDAPT